MATLSAAPIPARDRLIEAAGEIFGDHGYEGATVREITRRAKVNLAAINYYFRDKEELYLETLNHAMRTIFLRTQPEDLGATPEEQLLAYISGLLQRVLNPARPGWHGKLLARELTSPSRLLNVLVETFIRPHRDTLHKIIQSAAGGKLSETHLSLIGASVIGQCLYYRNCRAVSERLSPEILEAPDYLDHIAVHITQFSLAGIAAQVASKKCHK